MILQKQKNLDDINNDNKKMYNNINNTNKKNI